ncbi:MAG: glycosyltransferase family 25 protein [Chthoniobacterales bacterium]
MRAFVINLDSATDRWAFIQNSFAGSALTLERVPAVGATGLRFPDIRFANIQYEKFHGRTPNLRELACYLSHLKAIDAFLATGEEHALIGEDDLVLRPDFDAALGAARHQARHWNILRLTGLSRGRPAPLVRLCGDYFLCVCLSRLKGAGAYVVDRRAATAFRAKLLPMRLPFDHAFDREWTLRLRAAYIFPFPASQTESPFLSSVQPGTYPKLSVTRRAFSTYPYQAWNESTRYFVRGSAYLRFKLSALRRHVSVVP